MLISDLKQGIKKLVPQVIAELPMGYVADTAHDAIQGAIERAVGHPGAPSKIADISIEYFEMGANLEGIRVKPGIQPARYYQIMAG